MFSGGWFSQDRIEVLDFKKFMRKEPLRKKVEPVRMRTIALSVAPISPMAFVDPLFITIAVGIVAVALCEKGLADYGHVAIAEAVHTFLNIAFPIVGFLAMYLLITQFSFLGW